MKKILTVVAVVAMMAFGNASAENCEVQPNHWKCSGIGGGSGGEGSGGGGGGSAYQGQGQQQGQGQIGINHSSNSNSATGGQGGTATSGGQGGTANGGTGVGVGVGVGGNVAGEITINNSIGAEGGGSGGGGDESVNIVDNSTYEAQKRNPVATAYSAPLVTSNDTCMGSTSAGGQGITLGLSFATTWTDDDCIIRKDARFLHNAQHQTVALGLMCEKDMVKRAVAQAGSVLERLACGLREDGSDPAAEAQHAAASDADIADID